MSRDPEANGHSKEQPDTNLAERVVEPQVLELLYGANRSGEREITLRDYWRIMRNRAWLIVSITAMVTLLVTVWTTLAPGYYEGHARIEIDLINANPPPTETENRLPPAELDPEYLATQLQIIRGSMVLERVIQALDLEHDPIYRRYMSVGGRKIRQLLQLAFLVKKDRLIENEPQGSLLTNALNPAMSAEDLEKSKEFETYVRDLQQRITVEPVKEPSTVVKDTRLVSITVRHPSPVLASRLANAIADAAAYADKERKLQGGKTTNAYLAHRIDDLQSEIRGDEAALAKYASQHNILSLEPNQNTEIDRLAALNRQLVEAENARKEAEANYREALEPIAGAELVEERGKQLPGFQIGLANVPVSAGEASDLKGADARPVNATSEQVGSDLGRVSTAADALAEENAKQIADLESKLPELRQKRAQLLVGATENWPEVKEVDQQIASIEASLEQMRAHAAAVMIANLETKYRQELAHETSIRNALEAQRRITQVQNQDAVGYRLLQQQIDTKKNLLNEYLKQFNGNDVAQTAMASNIHVIDYATLPAAGETAGPWRLVWVMLAFVVTLPLSMCLAFFLESWDNTLRSSDEVREAMQLPVLAVIPSAEVMGSNYLLRSAEHAGLWLLRPLTPGKQRRPGPPG